MERDTGDPRVVEAAVALASRGVPVMPVGPNKRPRVATWLNRQRVAPSAEQVRAECSHPGVTGYGVVLGAVAGRAFGGAHLGIVDIETAISFGRFLDAASLHMDDSRVVETGGGGRHFYVLSDEPIPNLGIYDAETGEHLGDTKGDGGYAVGPHSLHASGRRYAPLGGGKHVYRVPDFRAWLAPILEALGWATSAPSTPSPNGDGDESGTAALLSAECREGGRHTTLVQIAGYLRTTVSRAHALNIALLWNKDRCSPPLSPEEVVTTVRDVYARYPEPPRLMLQAESEDDAPKLTPIPPPLPEVCRRGWLGDYIATMAPTTEAPDAYHAGCGLVAAGVILGRSCWHWYGRRLYPNVYAILVGPSGSGRKDTAMDRAETVLQPPDLRVPIHEKLTTIASAEGLIQKLAAGKPTLVRLSEVSVLLRNARREGTSNLIPYVTLAFDCPDQLEIPTRNNPVRALAPFLSILGGTTPDWFDRDISEDDIRGGFVGRFLFLAGVQKPDISNPPTPDPGRVRMLSAHLYRTAEALRQRGGVEIRLSDDGAAWWEAFYAAERKRPYEGDFAVLSQRVPLYVRKGAMLFAVLDGGEAITAEHLEAAAALVRLSQAHVEQSHPMWGASLDAKAATRMLRFIAERGGVVTKRELHQREGGRMKSSDFQGVVRVLLAFNQLAVLNDGRLALPGHEDARRNGHGG